MSKKAIIAIIVSIVVVLGGGVAAYFTLFAGKDEPEEPTVYVDPHADEARSILTGQWLPKDIQAQRPIAIMNENDKNNQPLFGLNRAGIIYECPVEGSYTRFMPIYDNNIEDDMKLGNVRSCRPYYVYLAHEYDSIYVNWGQSIYALNLLKSGYIDNVSGVLDFEADNVVFFKTNDHPSPNNIYTNRAMILAGAAKKGYRTQLDTTVEKKFTFAEDDKPNMLDSEDAMPCEVVKPYYFYNLPWFEYDAETGKYKRFQFKAAQIDGVDNSQIEVDNIIFQDADSHDMEAGDTAGSPYIDVQTTGSGTGKYFTRGKMIDITWKRQNENAPAKYYDMQGNEIVINQGKTWICLTENKYKSQNKYYATIDEFKGQ